MKPNCEENLKKKREGYTHLKVITGIETITTKLMNHYRLLPDSAVSHSDTAEVIRQVFIYYKWGFI